jgi:hypothetical protein
MLLVVAAAVLLPGGGVSAAAAGRCTTSTPVKTYDKCIALPTQGATLAWTYDAANATLDAAFTGSFVSPSGWVAWGINPDRPAMTRARVLAAFSDPTTGSLLALPFVLEPEVKLQASPLVSRPLDVPLLSSSASLLAPARTVRDGASVTIAATVRLSPNRTRLHFVWNRGLYVQGYSPTIHPTDASDLASHATVDILTTATEASSTAAAALQWLHGSLNALSWGLLLPVGAVPAPVRVRGARVVLRARRGAGDRVHHGGRRVRAGPRDGRGVAGRDVHDAPWARHRGGHGGEPADAGGVLPAQDDQPVPQVLEVVPPPVGVRVRGRRGGERVPGFRGRGARRLVLEARVLPGARRAGRRVRGAGGERVGDLLSEAAGGEDHEERGEDVLVKDRAAAF